MTRSGVASRSSSAVCSSHPPDTRGAARFGEQVDDIWLNWALWGVITQPQVNGVEHNVLPAGGEGPGVYFGGRHSIPQIWCDDGDCG